jgi:hypothetical protein
VAPEIDISDLQHCNYIYQNFPKLNNKLYIKIDTPKQPYHSKFEIGPDEWCYNIQSLSYKNWANYLIYVIYEIWFQMFSIIISLYDDNKAESLIEHAVFLLETLSLKKHITPSRSLYTKLIRACGRSTLTKKLQNIWKGNISDHSSNAL